MRVAAAIWAVVLASAPVAAGAQSAPTPPQPTAQNPAGSTGPLGGYRGASNDPGAGLSESLGSFVDTNKGREAAAGMPKGAYGIELARRIAQAKKLVEAAGEGRVLTASDSRRVRDQMREDFIAWRKQYDLLPSAYRAERDRWIVDEGALTPEGWAKHRVDWLEAQREWIVSHGG